MADVNKAFVRDPEPQDPRCPEPTGCGAAGVAVEAETLETQLAARARGTLSDPIFYCPNPRCAVGYYDALGGVVSRDEIRHPAYPKPASAPLCRCLGITAETVIEEAKRGDREGIRRIVAQAEQGAHRCRKAMPSGRPCATEARRLFLAHFGSGS